MLLSFSLLGNDFYGCILIILRCGVENRSQCCYGELGNNSRGRHWTQQRKYKEEEEESEWLALMGPVYSLPNRTLDGQIPVQIVSNCRPNNTCGGAIEPRELSEAVQYDLDVNSTASMTLPSSPAVPSWILSHPFLPVFVLQLWNSNEWHQHSAVSPLQREKLLLRKQIVRVVTGGSSLALFKPLVKQWLCQTMREWHWLINDAPPEEASSCRKQLPQIWLVDLIMW